MSRPTYIALCTACLLAGCKVEPTPQQYFDHRDPIAVEREAAAEELQARLLAMGQALNLARARKTAPIAMVMARCGRSRAFSWSSGHAPTVMAQGR